MKYGYRPDGGGDSFWDMFFPWTPVLDLIVTGFALIGFVSSIVKRHLNGAWLGIMCLALMGATFLARDSLPVIGLLWNPRLLPFLYLVRLLLMMVGIADTATFIVKGWQARELSSKATWVTGAVTSGIVLVVVLVCELFLFQQFPGGKYVQKGDKNVYTVEILGWRPVTLSKTASDAVSDGWTRYNFNGYEGRPAYGEYKALVDTMARLGEDPAYGCGRALWENNGDTGAYGTTMALMLLPHWTDGCIASQEGLFFEASGTTPYHFLTAAAMSKNSSNPVRELRYADNNASVGVPMMQKLGIKYLMVFTEAAKSQADTRSDLTLVAESGPWKVYRVADADVVVPLTVQPVVVNRREGDQRERNLELGTSWFQNPTEWAAMPADDGPADWQRIDVQVDLNRRVGNKPLEPGRKVDIVVPSQNIQPVALEPVTVSGVDMGDQDLRFSVSKPGVPVLVKISYFPNWKVDGALGPYRVAPNLMVVVPTGNEVYMHYDASGIDKGTWLLTLFGIGLMFLWRFRSGDVQHRTLHPFERPFDDPDGTPDMVAPGSFDETMVDTTIDPLLGLPTGRDDPPERAGSV